VNRPSNSRSPIYKIIKHYAPIPALFKALMESPNTCIVLDYQNLATSQITPFIEADKTLATLLDVDPWSRHASSITG